MEKGFEIERHYGIPIEMRIESASRIFLNFINGGANKKNVHSLEDYIRNEVYKLCSDGEIKLRR